MPKNKLTLDPYQIIQTVVISEKSNSQTEELNKYTFKVHKQANKIQISQAIEELFNVRAIAVNTSNYIGKKKVYKMKVKGQRASWKKAIVTLRDGDSINII